MLTGLGSDPHGACLYGDPRLAPKGGANLGHQRLVRSFSCSRTCGEIDSIAIPLNRTKRDGMGGTRLYGDPRLAPKSGANLGHQRLVELFLFSELWRNRQHRNPTQSHRTRLNGAPVLFQDVVHSKGTREADCDEQSSFRGPLEWTSTRMPDSLFAVESGWFSKSSYKLGR